MRFKARDPVQIRLTGAGGQGVITAGILLAEAALRDGCSVVQTQSYGPEARLGASKAEVIISSQPIAYPEVIHPDVLICLSRDAARRYVTDIRDNTIVLLDASADPADGPGVIYRLPLAQTAADAGSKAATNVVALWVVNAIASLVTPESLRSAVFDRLPARFRDANEQALRAAQTLVEQTLAPPGTSTTSHNGGCHTPQPQTESTPCQH